MPILCDINSKQLNTINVLINKIARFCCGFASYRWNNSKTLSKCGWLSGTQLLYYSILNFVHKINFDSNPKALFELFKYKENIRGRYTRCPDSLKREPKTKNTREGLLAKGLFIYKKIPDIYKTYNIKKFKNEIKKYIKEKLPPDKMIKYNDYI